MIGELIGALAALDPPPEAEELADALWLAQNLGSPGAPVAQPRAKDHEPAGEFDGGRAPEAPAASRTEHCDVADAVPSGDVPIGLFPQAKDSAGLDLARSPAVPALTRTLPLARALRPLRQTTSSRSGKELDEDATSEQVAETGLWAPAMRAIPERLFDVALVVDASASMVVWRRTAAELRVLLEQLGAFRDVRVWRVNADCDRLVLSSGGGSGRSPAELIDPTRRRIVLVVSDCIGRSWGNGHMAGILERWGNAGPVAILQPLPQRLWRRCAATFDGVHLGSSERGLPNAGLSVRLRDGDGPGGLGLPVPVMEIEPRWLAPWATLVGSGGRTLTGMALLTRRPVMETPHRGDDGGSAPALDRVRRFRATASPTAFQLAAYLAATPLRLPVMRLVQRAMLAESRPSHLAEVFLSDLMRRVTPEFAADPDDVEYDFHDGVRDVLLSNLHRAETLRILRSVWEFIRNRLGSPLDFPALLTTIESGNVELERPFASVAWRVLRRLGGRYSEIAQHLAPTEAAVSAALPGAGGVSLETREVLTAGRRTPVASERHSDQGPAVWGGVPPRNSDFTGRGHLIHVLREQLSGEVTALLPHALHGLGGVGKTQVAVEYAYRYAGDYDLVWWIPAEQITLVRSSLAALALRLGLAPSSDINRTAENVLHALSTSRPQRRWLLVYDNAGDPSELTPLIPEASGHVLITSRDTRWDEFTAALQVDVFQRAESVALLQRRAPHLSPQDADRLAEKLGDLPLAVEHAAAWHAATGMEVDEYVTLLDRKSGELSASSLPDDYPRPLAATWGLAYERLLDKAPVSGQLLELCAFFGPEPITLRLLAMGRYANLPSQLVETVRDHELLRVALREIDRYSLAGVDVARGSVQVHRLIQVVLRARLTDEEQSNVRRLVHAVLAAANPDATPGDETTWERRAEIAPHVVPSGIIDGDGREVRRVAIDQIRYLYVLGDYEGSRRLAELVRDRWQDRYGPDDEQTLVASTYLANALRGLGEIVGAAAVNADALARMRRRYGDDHPQTLFAANSVGADLRLRGEFARARELDEDTLQRMRRVFGNDEAITLRCANNLGIDLRLLGEYQSALRLDEETLERYRRLLGDGHRDTILAITEVARDVDGLGRYQAALELMERWMEPNRALLGDDHVFVLSAAMSHAATLRKSGRYLRARQTAEETYRLSLRRFGENHHVTLAALTSLANNLVATGDPARGGALTESALAGYRRTLGENHPFVHMCASNLGIALRANGEPTAARKMDETALTALRRLVGPNHYYSVCCATGLANDLYLLGELQQAEELSADTLAKSRTIRVPGHPYTLACSHNYAIILGAIGDTERATLLREETLAAFRTVLGQNHPDTIGADRGELVECDVEPEPL